MTIIKRMKQKHKNKTRKETGCFNNKDNDELEQDE